VSFILEPSEPAKAAVRKRVSASDYPDGRLSIRYNGVEMAYRTFDHVRRIGWTTSLPNRNGAA
jgi:hypothetical protein